MAHLYPFIVNVPIKSGDFPVRYVSHYQRVSHAHDPQLVRGRKGEASPEETVPQELVGELLGEASINVSLTLW